MTLVSIPTDEEASPEARVIFKHSRKMFGRVANAVRVASHSPRAAQSIFGFIVAIARQEITGEVDKQTKALIIIKTSMLNSCSYCIGHNLTFGKAAGLSDEQIAILDGDYLNSELFTPGQRAALAWSEYLTERTHRSHPEAMVNLKAHYSEAQIIEITMLCGQTNFWNRLTDGLKIDMEDVEVQNLFVKSRSIDVADYVAYMKDCWWNDSDAASNAPRQAAE